MNTLFLKLSMSLIPPPELFLSEEVIANTRKLFPFFDDVAAEKLLSWKARSIVDCYKVQTAAGPSVHKLVWDHIDIQALFAVTSNKLLNKV